MSKFFRSLSSGSDSSSEASTDSEDRTLDLDRETSHTDGAADEVSTALNDLNLPEPSSTNGAHSQVLLHALLEERCMNEVLREQSSNPRGTQQLDDASIRAEAKARYQRLCTLLAPHNLISTGLEHDGLFATRQRYRDGLDLLSRSTLFNATQRPSVPAPLRRLLTETNALQSSFSAPQSLQLTGPDSDASAVLTSVSPAHALLEPSRYVREFDQLGVLGKGGYGTVYCVKHKLDSNQYAIKIVPISAARMERIRSRGQQEVDELLLELRTIARLDHQYIVRYFSGWIEWTNVSSLPQASGASSPFDERQPTGRIWSEEQDAVLGAENSQPSLGRIVTESDEGIVFESSVSQRALGDTESFHGQQASFASLPEVEASRSGVSELAPSLASPALALHLQMAVYPITLADFLTPLSTSTSNDVSVPHAHCFHLQPSLNILMALLDGVEYLHDEGIVHRDLKPANIFMAETTNPRSTRGSVDLLLCTRCRAAGIASATTLKVRIGDFGLVTDLAQPERTTGARAAPVGTEIYRPLMTTSNASASLDIFALGIIAFELLWPFRTRKYSCGSCCPSCLADNGLGMERHETLQRLRHGEFPLDFCEQVGDASGDVQGCIHDMLSHDDSKATIATLKKRVACIQAATA